MIQPVVRQMLKMKVVFVILILFNFSSTHFISHGIVRNWDNSLVGLDFLVHGNYHLDTEIKKVKLNWEIVNLTQTIFQEVKSTKKVKQEKFLNGPKSTLRIV